MEVRQLASPRPITVNGSSSGFTGAILLKNGKLANLLGELQNSEKFVKVDVPQYFIAAKSHALPHRMPLKD
nr:hypothetical protein [Tanacetum cinerariifolium]